MERFLFNAHYLRSMVVTIRHIFGDNLTPEKFKDYIVFLMILASIFSLMAIRGDYILAPPYAVSAYLVVFKRKTKYSSKESLVATYGVVILSSDAFHFLLGESLVGMILNVLIVSAFITFTNLTHPPAIALTIFSYLAGDSLDFTISSGLSLLALLLASLIIEKYFKS